MDLELAGKAAFVTGGSRGLGRAIALRLAAEGCNVSICARGAERLEATLDELRAQAVRAHGVLADVTTPGGVETAIEAAAHALGGLDLLVANAGGGGVDFLASTIEDWKRTFDINLFHAVRAIRAAVPHMERRGGGSIVIVASVSGRRPERILPDYGVAKAAEIFLAKSLAWDLAPKGIRLNSVSPGSILHPDCYWTYLRTEEPTRFAAYQQGEFPSGRLGTAEEVADVVAFVLSPRAVWINGADIPVDGAQAGGLRQYPTMGPSR